MVNAQRQVTIQVVGGIISIGRGPWWGPGRPWRLWPWDPHRSTRPCLAAAVAAGTPHCDRCGTLQRPGSAGVRSWLEGRWGRREGRSPEKGLHSPGRSGGIWKRGWGKMRSMAPTGNIVIALYLSQNTFIVHWHGTRMAWFILATWQNWLQNFLQSSTILHISPITLQSQAR